MSAPWDNPDLPPCKVTLQRCAWEDCDVYDETAKPVWSYSLPPGGWYGASVHLRDQKGTEYLLACPEHAPLLKAREAEEKAVREDQWRIDAARRAAAREPLEALQKRDMAYPAPKKPLWIEGPGYRLYLRRVICGGCGGVAEKQAFGQTPGPHLWEGWQCEMPRAGHIRARKVATVLCPACCERLRREYVPLVETWAAARKPWVDALREKTGPRPMKWWQRLWSRETT